MSNRGPLLAALVLIGLTSLLLRPSIRGFDGVGNYVYLMSMINDGDLDFSNEYAAFDVEQNHAFQLSETIVDPGTGLPANRYGIGAALFWTPTVLVVHGALKLFAPDLATGLSRPYEWGVGLASAWWCGLGLWLLFIRIREQFGSMIAWTASAGIVLATPLGFYQWAHGSMSHAVGFFQAVMAMLILERLLTRPRLLGALMLGLWAGLLMVTRIQDVTWAVALGLALAVFWKPGDAPSPSEARDEHPNDVMRFQSNRWIALGLFALGLVLTLLPQMVAWNELYGSWFSGPAPYLNREAGSFAYLPVHLLGVLVSERGGVFAWHPVLLLAVIGLILGRRTVGRPFITAALIGLGLQLYLVSCWSMWWGGASFGNRFFISSYPFLAVGLAAGLQWLRGRCPPWVGPVLILVLIGWNGALLIQYGAEMISREEEAGWLLVLKNQFTEVPRWVIARIGL